MAAVKALALIPTRGLAAAEPVFALRSVILWSFPAVQRIRWTVGRWRAWTEPEPPGLSLAERPPPPLERPIGRLAGLAPAERADDA
jgi:hypothetical protein